jgi:hypothetical protein
MSRSRSNCARRRERSSSSGRRQLVDGGDDVDHVTAQTIELADHQHVAAFEAIKDDAAGRLAGGLKIAGLTFAGR